MGNSFHETLPRLMTKVNVSDSSYQIPNVGKPSNYHESRPDRVRRWNRARPNRETASFSPPW